MEYCASPVFTGVIDSERLENAMDFVGYLHAGKMPQLMGASANLWAVSYKGNLEKPSLRQIYRAA